MYVQRAVLTGNKVFAAHMLLSTRYCHCRPQATLNGEVRTLKQQSNALADSAAQAKFDLLNASQVRKACWCSCVPRRSTKKMARHGVVTACRMPSQAAPCLR